MHMHRATKPIVLAVSAVFGLGLVTAAAANSHGEAVSDLAKASKALVGEARSRTMSSRPCWSPHISPSRILS